MVLIQEGEKDTVLVTRGAPLAVDSDTLDDEELVASFEFPRDHRHMMAPR